jgi:hypothetical protein
MRIFLSIVLVFISQGSLAGKPTYKQLTGGDVLSICGAYGTAKRIPGLSRTQGVCEGYVSGVIDTNFTFCIPDDTEYLTIIETVRSYIKVHKEVHDKPAPDAISLAVNNSWSCSK